MRCRTARRKFLGCEILYREACKLAAESAARVDVEFLPKGLHDLETDEMRRRIQERIDQADRDGYERILLGYARCNDGVAGLAARGVPLVIPRAHDCISLFFGSRDEYRRQFDAEPGTYYMTTGWAERNEGWEFGAAQVPAARGIMAKLGLDESFEQMVARYGRDNAEYILSQLGNWKEHYRRMLYLEMGICDEREHIARAAELAAENGWRFERQPGSLGLLARLFEGPWDDDFVVVEPGQVIQPRSGERILDAADPQNPDSKETE
jgi:hypothetical protein